MNATVQGFGSDNPEDPRELTELQRSRSVLLTFDSISSFDVRYNKGVGGEQKCYAADGAARERLRCAIVIRRSEKRILESWMRTLAEAAPPAGAQLQMEL